MMRAEVIEYGFDGVKRVMGSEADRFQLLRNAKGRGVIIKVFRSRPFSLDPPSFFCRGNPLFGFFDVNRSSHVISKDDDAPPVF